MLYGNLTRTAIHTVKPDNMATFLGKKLTGNYQGEMGNRFNMRIEGARIKHNMGPVSIKIYDKFGLILCVETTVNDVSFCKHYRQVEHRDGTKEMKTPTGSRPFTVCRRCGNCCGQPIVAIWSYSLRSRTTPPDGPSLPGPPSAMTRSARRSSMANSKCNASAAPMSRFSRRALPGWAIISATPAPARSGLLPATK